MPCRNLSLGERWPGRKFRGQALVLVGAVCFGTQGVFARIGYDHGAGIGTLLFLRFAIAAVLTGAIVVVVDKRLGSTSAILRGLIPGAIAVGQSGAFFLALTRAPVTLVTVIFYVYPVFVMLGSMVVFRERIGRLQWLLVGGALGGIILTVGIPDTAGTKEGILLSILGAAFVSVYILWSRAILRSTLTPLQLTAVIYTVAALVFGCLVGVRGASLPVDAIGWLAVIGVALIGTVAATLLLFVALRLVDAGVAAALGTLEPVVAVVLAISLLGESLTLHQVVGGSVVIAAVGGIAWSSGRKRAVYSRETTGPPQT